MEDEKFSITMKVGKHDYVLTCDPGRPLNEVLWVASKMLAYIVQRIEESAQVQNDSIDVLELDDDKPKAKKKKGN